MEYLRNTELFLGFLPLSKLLTAFDSRFLSEFLIEFIEGFFPCWFIKVVLLELFRSFILDSISRSFCGFAPKVPSEIFPVFLSEFLSKCFPEIWDSSKMYRKFFRDFLRVLFRNGFSTISPKIFCVIPAKVLLESFRDSSLEGFQIPLGISPTYRLGIAPRTFSEMC